MPLSALTGMAAVSHHLVLLLMLICLGANLQEHMCSQGFLMVFYLIFSVQAR